MDKQTRKILNDVAHRFGTPCYVYLAAPILRQIDQLREVFENRFLVSYAVKANPNLVLLDRVCQNVDTLDVSSIGEVERALNIEYPAEKLTFSGPAKRLSELERAVGRLTMELEIAKKASQLWNSPANRNGR